MPKFLSNSKNRIFLLLFSAALLRIISACIYRGFESDTACFYSWASMLRTNGFAAFYSPDYFCDYPPGYLYILYPIGGIIKLLHLDPSSELCLLLLKSPAILSDLIAGIFIWYHADKYLSAQTSLLLTAGYLFHPAVLINSSLWGQTDAVYTLAILLVCIFLSDRKYIPAYFSFALGILLKPQTLMFTPLILCAVTEDLLSHRAVKRLLFHITTGGASLLFILICSLPFGIEPVISQYTDTLSSYPYAAVNACNIWGLFGQNWVSQDTMLGALSYAQIGTLCIILMTLLSFLIFFALGRRSDRYYLTGAFLVISMFLFSVRMHERYLFPAMILLLFAFICNRQQCYYCHYWLISLCHFCNVYYVLFYYDPANYDRKSFPLLLVSFLTVISGLLFYVSLAQTASRYQGKFSPWSIRSSWKKRKTGEDLANPIRSSRAKMPFTKIDFLIMTGISLFYGIFAFVNLGITRVPVTECTFPYNTYLELEAQNDQPIASIYWYLQNEQGITCQLEIKERPDAPWQYIQDIALNRVFSWEGITLSTPASAVRITNITADTEISELVFTDSSQNPIVCRQASVYPPLFDESGTFSGALSAQTSVYFDEIYYTRTVDEFMNGIPAYENTHPPLGKIWIMLGVMLFGTSPFGFRFMGTLFGVIMLPFLYLLGRNLTRNRFMGGFLTFLFAFDFMHFTQTRLATIDVFITFFIIVMYYFMEQYANTSFYDTPLKKTFLPLGACGIAFGLGVAVKWTGLYAGAGLAVVFFLQLYKRMKEYRFALCYPDDTSEKIPHQYIIRHFREYTLKTLGFCMIFFVGIPFVIYVLSYLPFSDGSGSGLLKRMLDNQLHMFRYHSLLTDTHPYASSWYQWPFMIRPIFYYANILEGDLRQGISAFGNPLVWWSGIPAFMATGYLALFRRDKTARFLTIAYLAQYLPWVFVSRCTFIYHYFPSVPFITLMLGYSFLQLKNIISTKNLHRLCIGYACAAFILFLLFYPVLSGTAVSLDYVDNCLRWMKSWVLVLSNT